jgi:hypothetical protein
MIATHASYTGGVSEGRHPVGTFAELTGLSGGFTAKLLARIFVGVLDLQTQARQ